jgi:hypothetical protein
MSHQSRAHRSERRHGAGVVGRALAFADRTGFWIASAAVFVANAILSMLRGEWALAILQAATGLLAGVAAASVAESQRSSGSAGSAGSHDDANHQH